MKSLNDDNRNIAMVHAGNLARMIYMWTVYSKEEQKML